MMQLSRLGEFGLLRKIEQLLRETPATPVSGTVDLAMGDDAALLSLPPGHRLVATADALIDEVHFRRDWTSAPDLGWKALAVNVSDLGAMGAAPLACLVTLMLPPETAPVWIQGLYRGFADAAVHFGCPVAGGDTVRSAVLGLNVTALGSLPAGQEVCRSGASVGDWLCVTGVLGASAAGLHLLGRFGRRAPRNRRTLLQAHCRPQPPVKAGWALAAAGLPTAMMDLSDGLASDALHLAQRSKVGLEVDEGRLPISDDTRRTAAAEGIAPTDWALYGGEDYELLFTVPPDRFPEVPPLLATFGITATRVGRVVAPRGGVRLRTLSGRRVPLRRRGFRHFGAGLETEG